MICDDSDTITFVKLQSTMLQGIERYLKQAIVDKNASVSSAALVSALVGWEKFFFCYEAQRKYVVDRYI